MGSGRKICTVPCGTITTKAVVFYVVFYVKYNIPLPRSNKAQMRADKEWEGGALKGSLGRVMPPRPSN